VPALNALYRQYRDRVAFYVVYIQEAHPSDAWQLASNLRDKVVYASPRTAEERAEIAGACVRNLGLEIPALLDNPANTTEASYTGWPDRLYVIDREGRVAYKSAAGPFGFHPEGVRETLGRLIH
jgi:type I thyroxine 5'-deiodinase